MCKFFSAISNGEGEVKFFKPEDIAREMAKGNPKRYDWNSHTSIASYHGINGAEEDKWNKWEYDVDKKKLSVDSLNSTNDDKRVARVVRAFLKESDLLYLRNMYGNNSGYRNSGYYNSGDYNSGTLMGHFCTEKKYFLFDIPCTKEEADEVRNLGVYNYFNINEFIYENKMTTKEKKANPNYKGLGGYLKTIDYKQAWKKVPKDIIDKIKKLKNFDKKKFKEITGLNIK